MKYIIMLLIVVGLALSDFVTGIIKAYIVGKPSSRKMREGGLHKFGEVIIMTTAIGLEIGIAQLGKYYGAEQLAGIAGSFTAIAVFCYIVVMEIISILENYAEINPSASWALKMIKRLKPDSKEKE